MLQTIVQSNSAWTWPSSSDVLSNIIVKKRFVAIGRGFCPSETALQSVFEAKSDEAHPMSAVKVTRVLYIPAVHGNCCFLRDVE